MNNHLVNKKKRYEQISESECFKNGLRGLATVELNITEMCSRMCSFCPRGDTKVYKNQKLFMKQETVDALTEQFQVNDYKGDLSIAGFGEPMIHPTLSNLIKAFPSNHTTIITNGDFLNKDSLEKLIDAGLKKIVVSCYDGSEARDKFKALLERTSVEWDIRELWGTFEEVVEQNDFNNRTGLVPGGKAIQGQCFIPFYKLIIDWNGEILLCSNDWYRKETGFGNINTVSLKDIWFGEKMTEIRKNLAVGNRCGKACKDCNVKGTLLGRESFTLLSPSSD